MKIDAPYAGALPFEYVVRESFEWWIKMQSRNTIKSRPDLLLRFNIRNIKYFAVIISKFLEIFL